MIRQAPLSPPPSQHIIYQPQPVVHYPAAVQIRGPAPQQRAQSQPPIYERPPYQPPVYERARPPVYERSLVAAPVHERQQVAAPVYDRPPVAVPTYERTRPIYEKTQAQVPMYEKAQAPAYQKQTVYQGGHPSSATQPRHITQQTVYTGSQVSGIKQSNGMQQHSHYSSMQTTAHEPTRQEPRAQMVGYQHYDPPQSDPVRLTFQSLLCYIVFSIWSVVKLQATLWMGRLITMKIRTAWLVLVQSLKLFTTFLSGR
jgi:hypothetical protein